MIFNTPILNNIGNKIIHYLCDTKLKDMDTHQICMNCGKNFILKSTSGEGKYCSQKCYYGYKKILCEIRIKQDLLEGKKTCSTCKERLSYSEFIKEKKQMDGYRSSCKSCSSISRQKSKSKKQESFIPSISEKKCRKCFTSKSVQHFPIQITTKDGYAPLCRDCKNVESKEFIEKRKREKLYVSPDEIKKCGHCKERKSKTAFFNSSRTKDGLRGTCNECEKLLRNKYRNKSNDRNLKRYKNDPIFKMKKSLRGRLAKYIKRKSVPMNNIIGCDWVELKNYIENKFLEGMTWENWGQYGWHVDHIVPLDSAKTENDLYKLSHYTNLQPLWAKDNRLKSNKIIEY